MKYAIAAALSGIVFFFVGSAFSKTDITEVDALQRKLASLENELNELKSEKSRTEACEEELVELSESYESLNLREIKSLRESCSAERLSKFDAEFGPISAKITKLEAKELKQKKAERAKREAEKLKREKEAELRAKKRSSEWIEHVEKNRITDTQDVYLALNSKPYLQKFGRDTARLTLRCQENTTALILNIGEYVGDDSSSVYSEWKNVTLRIDDQEPIVRQMSVATNNEAVGFWNGSQSIPFIKQMLGADKLVARITPYGENTREIVFPISGLEFFIDPLRENCGW